MGIPKTVFAITDPYQAEMLRLRLRGKYTRGPDDECWPWEGTTNHDGYGVFTIRKPVTMLAHRAVWEAETGEALPPGIKVLHHCDNPPCVNWVKCLFTGTNADNMRDMFAKGRRPTVALRGEVNPQAKLTNAQAREIRALRGILPYREVMARYGIGRSTLYRIWDDSSPHWGCIKH